MDFRARDLRDLDARSCSEPTGRWSLRPEQAERSAAIGRLKKARAGQPLSAWCCRRSKLSEHPVAGSPPEPPAGPVRAARTAADRVGPAPHGRRLRADGRCRRPVRRRCSAWMLTHLLFVSAAAAVLAACVPYPYVAPQAHRAPAHVRGAVSGSHRPDLPRAARRPRASRRASGWWPTRFRSRWARSSAGSTTSRTSACRCPTPCGRWRSGCRSSTRGSSSPRC